MGIILKKEIMRFTLALVVAAILFADPIDAKKKRRKGLRGKASSKGDDTALLRGGVRAFQKKNKSDATIENSVWLYGGFFGMDDEANLTAETEYTVSHYTEDDCAGTATALATFTTPAADADK